MATVKFSSRVPHDQRENPLAAALGARDPAVPLLDLTNTNPTQVGLAPKINEFLSDLPSKSLEQYKPEPLGSPAARIALAKALSVDRNIHIDPDELVLLSSTSEAYGLLFRILGSPGDTLWAPTPSYPLFDQIAQLEGLCLRKYNLRPAGGDWYLDTEQLNHLGEPSKRNAALLAVHPNNPTGSYLSSAEAHHLESHCERAGVPLIIDEVFFEYALEPNPQWAGSFIKRSHTPTLVLGGMSKAFCLPQLKLSWIYLGGTPSFRTKIRNALEYASDAYLSLSNIAQALLPRLLPMRSEIQAQVITRLKNNLEVLKHKTQGTAISVSSVSGGWYAMVALPPTLTDLEWALQALEDDLLTHPGFLFDLPNKANLVLSLMVAEDDFREGVERLIRCVERNA